MNRLVGLLDARMRKLQVTKWMDISRSVLNRLQSRFGETNSPVEQHTGRRHTAVHNIFLRRQFSYSNRIDELYKFQFSKTTFSYKTKQCLYSVHLTFTIFSSVYVVFYHLEMFYLPFTSIYSINHSLLISCGLVCFFMEDLGHQPCT